jgi:hypothetical protein
MAKVISTRRDFHSFTPPRPEMFNFSILLLAAAVFCCPMLHATAAAQIGGVAATVTRSAPGATLYSGGVSSPLRQWATLQPGDKIDTGLSGRVVIDLSDGSQVVVFPGSRVELKDFQSGGSWRDLLRVAVGRVRATINHYGKRPNPYRVYSPIASIAVRGTDFLVIVEPNGATRVLVYEGLVEVGSLINPQKSVLVRPGRNIIVRPDGDISIVTSAPRGELNEIRSPDLRAAYNSHGNSYTGLQSSRFTAFSDSHLDGLQNPAYATEFRQPSGRLYLVPSFSPQYGANSPNYTLSPQVSYFTPLGSRIVVGAGAAVTQTDIGDAQTEDYINRLIPIGSNMYKSTQIAGFSHVEGSVKFTTSNLSFIAARRFGRAGRTSFGMKFDYLMDRSSYSINRNSSEPMNQEPAVESFEARTHRASLTVGVTQDIGGDKKLGVYYRYNMGSVGNSHKRSGVWGFNNDNPQFFPATEEFGAQPGHSSEAGVLFRGSVTRRLFYGVESSILFERDQEEKDRHPSSITINGVAVTETYLNKRRVRQGMIGAGIGYTLRPRTVLSLDLSTGRASEDSMGRSYYSNLPPGIRVGSTGDYARERSSFRAWHIGGQTDVWRNLFAGASWFHIRERKRSVSGLYVPEEYRDALTGDYPSSEYSSDDRYKLLNLSAGWRLTPNWITQYIYSASYAYGYRISAPSHTLMFRYEFGRREEK